MSRKVMKAPFRISALVFFAMALSVFSLQKASTSSQLFFDHFDGAALDTSRWSVLDGGGGMSVSGSLFQTSGGPDHKRINSVATFAPGGQNVKCRARIRLGGDYQKFGFNVNAIEFAGPTEGYYFDTFDNSFGSNENTIRLLALSIPASSPPVELLNSSVSVTWFEFHEFAVERTPSEVIFSIDNQEVARINDTFAAALPVSVWNDRPPLMQTDWVEVSRAASGCVPPPANLSGWWPGDGNAGDIVGGNNGTLNGGATFAAGMVGQGFSFDGANGSVNIPATPSLNAGSQVTIDFWMKSDPNNLMNQCCQGLVTTDFYAVEISGGGDPIVGINFFANTGSGFFHTSDANGGGAVISAGTWHHIAGTYDGTKLQLYVDGLPFGNSRPLSGTILPMLADSFLTIGSEDGRTVCPFCIGTRYFKGRIDEVEVFNRALSAAEIQDIFNAGSAGKCKNRAPVAICQNVTVAAGSGCAANASINNGSFDPDGGDTITVAQSPPGPYPLGATTVTLTVTDNHGASSQCAATVTVADNTPPTITDASASPSSLWPPDHKMKNVMINYATADNCGPVTCALNVASNEPVNDAGDGNTEPDWEVLDEHHLLLRAERAGDGNGRIYTITITCTDSAGNSSTKIVTVSVPHN